jgi:hypothetical protein
MNSPIPAFVPPTAMRRGGLGGLEIASRRPHGHHRIAANFAKLPELLRRKDDRP